MVFEVEYHWNYGIRLELTLIQFNRGTTKTHRSTRIERTTRTPTTAVQYILVAPFNSIDLRNPLIVFAVLF